MIVYNVQGSEALNTEYNDCREERLAPGMGFMALKKEVRASRRCLETDIFGNYVPSSFSALIFPKEQRAAPKLLLCKRKVRSSVALEDPLIPRSLFSGGLVVVGIA